MKSCNSCPAGQIPRTIRRGDTLWAIANEAGATVDEILEANPELKPENLQVGTEICVPFVGERYPRCRTGNYYVVRGGASLQDIGKYFGVSTDMLMKNNVGIDPTALYDGQVLCIPVAPSPVEINIADGTLKVVHKNGTETECRAEGEFSGNACVINKQLDIGKSGARVLLLSDGGAIAGKSSGQSGVVVGDEDMNALFNLAPVGTAVEGKDN